MKEHPPTHNVSSELHAPSDRRPRFRPGSGNPWPSLFTCAVGAAIAVALLEVACAASYPNAMLEALDKGTRALFLLLLAASFPVTAAAGFVLGGRVPRGAQCL